MLRYFRCKVSIGGQLIWVYLNFRRTLIFIELKSNRRDSLEKRMCNFLSQVPKLRMLEMTLATSFRPCQAWGIENDPMTGLSMTLQWDS
jgi:hypothetical protein